MKKKKRNIFDPCAAEHFIDSVNLIFDEEKKAYQNVTMYDADNPNKIFTTVTDAKEAKVKALVVVIEATHSGRTLNFTEYVGEKMEKSTPTWLTPFNKPVLKDHNSRSVDARIGTVKNAEYGNSLTHLGSQTIFLTMNIVDENAIQKFLDGRYSTVSIGAKVKELTCQICGRDILQESFCGHWLGNKYKKITKDENGKDKETLEVCYWTIGECEYYEVSVVNTPADTKQTGPISMQWAKQEEELENEESEDSKELEDLEDFLDSSDEQSESDNNINDDSDNENKKEQDLESNIDLEKISQFTDEIKSLKDENEILQMDNSALKLDNEKIANENKELKEMNSALNSQLKNRTNQTLKLGRQLKDILIETISIFSKDKIDTEHYVEKTFTDIKKEYDNIINRVSKNIPQIGSPGFADNTALGVDNEENNSQKNIQTLKDFLDDFIKI